jgi:hypothetical protein
MIQPHEYVALIAHSTHAHLGDWLTAYSRARHLSTVPTVPISAPAAPPDWSWGLQMLGHTLLRLLVGLWTGVEECSPWSGLITAAFAALVSWSWWQSRRAEQHALARACWLDITPPAQPPGEGAEALPRALTGLLAAMPTQPSHIRPRLAVEMITDGQHSRIGLWLPAGADATRVAAAITQALPGARVSRTNTPGWKFPDFTIGRELRPATGPWTVLVAPTARRSSSPPTDTGHESLRSVFTALAESPHPAVLQLVITPAPVDRGFGTRQADGGFGLGRLSARPALVLLARGAGRILLWALYTAMSLLSEALFSTSSAGQRSGATRRGDNSSPRPGYQSGTAGLANGLGVGYGSRATLPGGAADPAVAASERERTLKQGTRPLLHATLRVATLATSPDASSRSGAALAREVAIGYALALPRARIRPYAVRRFDRALRARRPGRGFYTTLAEIAALWHLPAEPARYRLPDPAARNRPARPDIPRLPTPRP